MSLLFTFSSISQDSIPRHKFIEKYKPNSNSIDFGIEYSELMQNKFKNIGKDNYTFFIGQRFGKISNGRFGLRYMVINAELSDEHIQNENQVAFIEGNRIDLTGSVHAQRFCFDYYPISIGVGYLSRSNKYVLHVSPVIYSNLGYNKWEFINTLYNENYLLKALTFGGGIRLKSVLFDVIIIENPLIDIFTYITKSRSVKATIGDTKITRPEHFGVFGWATIGFKVNLK
ncbi:MAG TPA: hypothetical protein PL017_00150 [Tenuifilaceae bacterium]|nr:hypothetical protein [Tenuifilaceae bacterium]HPE17248.1 hypothetical protein [Tenuifilaceae bacterium]HPJ44475.1 hypothetical protein [Tenuifilaceae bacterium]HPQ33013.1 hypothetical protein [Tenuifilaceae bacterium]HRX67944.1 hypothetical protein [Tenuifilaceae bacterium]